MEELTESARQCLVSQGIILGALSVLNSIGLLVTGIIIITRANDILHFTSLTHLAILEIVCGGLSCITTVYVWWIVTAYRNRQLELRLKYLDEHMSRALLSALLPFLLNFAALVVSAVFLTLKVESSSTYELKTAMSLYSMDVTRKVLIDKLQILLECCGSLSLLDWFLVDWQNSDLEPGIHLLNKSISDWDSVPYSCCCQEAPPPCVHHQLRAFGVGSLYTTGCADKLDSAVFYYVLMTVIMFFTSTFLTTIIIYSSRKLQTSARSAIMKGDATAPGCWWLVSPSQCIHNDSTEDFHPLLEKKPIRCLKKNVPSYFVQNKSTLTPFLSKKKLRQKCREDTPRRDYETSKCSTKNQDAECSEDWTRMANDASGSTSSTFLMTTTRATNSTPETRQSVSDTAVANLEVSHHLEHKVRPLFRT